MTRLWFGGLIATLLLAFYVYAVAVSVQAAWCGAEPACTATVTAGVETILTLVGGLISALVVAELAVTRAGAPPAARLLSAQATPRARRALSWVATAYLLVWVACGVAAVWVGFILRPDAVPALTDLARTWLGLAVAAAYAYLGIEPRG